MEHKNIPQKQLSKKRFIPMLVLIAIAIILCPFPNLTMTIVDGFINILELKYRESIISFSGVIIGIFHFYHVGRHSDKYPIGMMRSLTGLFTSIATPIGYAYMMNKGLNFAIGVANDFFRAKPFFTEPEKVDYLPLALVTIFIVFISGYLLWKMAEDFLYEIAKPTSETEGVSAPEPLPNQNPTEEKN